MVLITVLYDSRTGNTRKVAEAIAQGVKNVPGTLVEVKSVLESSIEDAVEADGFALGSPSHFGIMSGRVLTFLTELYSSRERIAGKPVAVFTTGAGGQVNVLENINRVIGNFNPRFIMPGLAVGGKPNESDLQQAIELGEKIARECLNT